MGMILFSIFALILDIVGIFINYINNNFEWVIVGSVLAGAVFNNIIWQIKQEIE